MDIDQLLRFALALLFVLGLIGGFALLGRRMGFTPRVTTPILGRTKRRLGVVEILGIDAKRKLLLIRRDDREHLILLGSGQDVVVESGIAAPASDSVGESPAGAEPARPSLLTRFSATGPRAGRPE